MLQGVPALALAQGVDLPLGGLQNFTGSAHLLAHQLGDLRRGGAQTPEHGLFPDDVRVAHRVGGGGSDLHELHDVVPGIVMVIAQGPHLVQHRDRVDGLGEVEHGIDGFIDLPVLLQEEVIGLDDADDVGDAPAVDQDRAQNRLLRLQRLRRLPG